MEQDKAAFRIAYEEEIGAREFLINRVERLRTQASAFLLATVLTSGGGLVLLSPELLKTKGTPVIELLLMLAGLVSAFTGTSKLSQRVEGALRLDPKLLADMATRDDYTDDRLYFKAARAHHRSNRKFAHETEKRRRWLNLTICGLGVELAGITALGWHALA